MYRIFNHDLPELQTPSKPIAINKPPRKEVRSPYQNHNKGRIQTLKNKIVNYILADCNVGAKIIKKSNIRLLIDDDAQNILVKAVGGGKMCLTNIDKNIVQQIVNEEEIDYRVKIDI